jgi:hypothetical protein
MLKTMSYIEFKVQNDFYESQIKRFTKDREDCILKQQWNMVTTYTDLIQDARCKQAVLKYRYNLLKED